MNCQAQGSLCVGRKVWNRARAIENARLVDYTGRLYREGKARISADLAGILERLGSNSQSWRSRMEKLQKGRLLGRFFAASQAKLREVVELFNSVRSANPTFKAVPGYANLFGAPA